MGLGARQNGHATLQGQGPLPILLQQTVNDSRRETIPRR